MSPDERVALYDPDDPVGRVVGAAARDEVRRRNLPHAATGVVVRRSTGEVLVHRRSDAKDLWPGAHDAACGGVVAAGETPEQAAVRELAEEVGITGVTPRPLVTAWYRDERAHYLAHLGEVVWDGPLRFADGEVAHAWWEHPDRLREQLADPGGPFVPDTRRLLGLLEGVRPDPGPWPAGSTVVHRFGRQGRTGFARLGRVLADDADGLALWVAPGSPVVEQVLADGRPPRAVRLEDRLSAPRARRLSTWWGGTGVVVLVPPGGHPWSVWWFYRPDGSFERWHGNLEAPQQRRRTAAGTLLVDTADRALDVLVEPDGTSSWKDEDEFAALTGRPGYWTRGQAPGIRADGEYLMAAARAGRPPFDGRWTGAAPDPGRPPPRFPVDWDVPHAAGP